MRQVYYPGLAAHPDHALAKRQMRGFGGMVSFAFEGTRADVDTFVRNLRVFALAESLGGIESLCCHPASMTHGSIPAAEREKRGVTETLLRLSVGIEDVERPDRRPRRRRSTLWLLRTRRKPACASQTYLLLPSLP